MIRDNLLENGSDNMTDGQYEFEEQRHPSLYMNEGDLVVSAKSATDSNVVQLFRVSKSILSDHSLVFKDIFSIGRNSKNEEFDGVPMVHMKEDASEDLAGLLEAIYNLMYVAYSHACKTHSKTSAAEPI